MINAIFAVDYNGSIGFNQALPWPNISEDMARFQELTTNGVVVMGRRTWDSLPAKYRPLPNRINVVVTTNPRGLGVRTISGDVLSEVLKLHKEFPGKTIWVIGGKEILEVCRVICNNLYVTHIKGNYRSDTRINMRDYLIGFRATSACPSEDRSCNFMTYRNILPLYEDLPQRPTTDT